MKLFETTNVLGGILFSGIFSFLGSYFLFYRKNVGDAFLSSSRSFWGEIGFEVIGNAGITIRVLKSINNADGFKSP